MSLPEICIRRPVFATVLSLLLVLVGIVSYDRLPVREYPNIDQPVVSVVTNYPGASPEIMESQVTQVLEASIAGIPGIDVLSSTSRSETSRITARFTLDTDPGGRRRRRARPGLARARPAARRGRRADHQQGRGRRRPDPLSRLHQRPASPRSTSPTSSTATRATGCRTCPAWPRCRSWASGATPCGSGSTATGWPPTA